MGSQTNGAEMPWDSGVPDRMERGDRLGSSRMMLWTYWLQRICLFGFAAVVAWIVAGV